MCSSIVDINMAGVSSGSSDSLSFTSSIIISSRGAPGSRGSVPINLQAICEVICVPGSSYRKPVRS